MIPLTYEKNKSYGKEKVCYICKKRFGTVMILKSILKSEITVIILKNMEELLIRFKI